MNRLILLTKRYPRASLVLGGFYLTGASYHTYRAVDANPTITWYQSLLVASWTFGLPILLPLGAIGGAFGGAIAGAGLGGIWGAMPWLGEITINNTVTYERR